MSSKQAACFGLALLLTTGGLVSQQAASDASLNQTAVAPADLELSLEIASQFATFRLATIREQVEVRTNSKEDHFYTVPLLMPRWTEFEKALTDKGIKPDDLKTHTVEFSIDLFSEAAEKELIQRINSALKRKNPDSTEIDGGQLSVFPYVFFQLSADLGNGSVPIYTSVDLSTLASNGAKRLNTTIVTRRVGTSVSATGKGLWGFYERRRQNNTVTGQLYSKGYAILSNVVSVRAQTLLDTQIDRRLFGEERFTSTTKLAGGSSGGGFSINLGVIGIGGGSGKSYQRSQSSSQRFVSRDYVSSLLREELRRIEVDVVGDSVTADELLEIATNFVFAAGQNTTLEFRKTAANSWQLGNDVLGYADLGKQEVRELLSAAPSLDTSASSDTTGEYGGAKGSSKKESDFTYKNSIKWERDGSSWIPSTVDISIVDRAELKDVIELDISKNVRSSTSDQYIYQFVSPVAGLYEEDLNRESLTVRLLQAEAANRALQERIEATNYRFRSGRTFFGDSNGRSKSITIQISPPLPGIPRIVGNLRSNVARYNDNFEFTIQNVRPNSFQLIVRRNEGPDGWGQNLHFEWVAIAD
ncbi:MAG: hypothetical protein AAGD01_17990 [Acidobacteriota bacterium]